MKKLILTGVALFLLLPVPPLSAAITLAPKAKTEDNGLVVTSALFGSGRKVADVTKRVTELLAAEPREFFAKASSLRVDPWPYRTKALAILYRYEGKNCLFVVQGGDKVSYKILVENATR
jgi:hypothetical protein